MNYCALDDAFQIAPGCEDDYAAKAARKEERRKARRSKAIKQDKDPDRQHLNKLPEVAPMTGLKERTAYEPFMQLDDNSCDYVKSQLPIIPPIKQSRSKFFGADPTEPFADYTPDAKNYQLEPDFLKAFEHAGVARAGSFDNLYKDLPNSNMYWKPFVNGAQTSYVDTDRIQNTQNISNEDIMKKLDRLWARLDDMNKSSPEQVTSELLMFISSGIFVIFMMDILVKKGSKMRF